MVIVMSNIFRQMIEKTKEIKVYEDMLKIFDELDKTNDK